MRLAVGRDLRQVGDGDDLVRLRQGAQFAADRAADLAADVGVELVENENR